LFSDLKTFDARFVHAYNKIAAHVPRDLRHGRCLDIGCGIGNGVIAALKHGATVAVGVDRDLGEFQHDVRLDEFGSICGHYGVSAERSLLIEADLFDLRFPQDTFDYVLMLDSIEHVPDPRRFVTYAASCLRPGGVLVVDTCPLYYSPVGHHLFSWFGEETDPWAHLRPDFGARVKGLGIDDWSMQRFEELNRITHDEIRRFFLEAGLEIREEVRSTAKPLTSQLLAQHRGGLDLSGVEEGWLFEDWILLVGGRPGTAHVERPSRVAAPEKGVRARTRRLIDRVRGWVRGSRRDAGSAQGS
jgi:2-polyprenyl-3-methyl-5-hydroxy-6-metoxy-1,4-benzoquinol methylase